MNVRHLFTIVLLGAVVVAGCGGGAKNEASSAGAAGATASGSKYDAGPRAAESPVDAVLAERGEQLFKEKGCSACHAFGAKMSGPDLNGVASRRTAAWIENQILHPDVMTKEDPISRELMAKHALQMPNQGLSPEEAKAVIEFLKSKEAPAASGESE
jgi:cytochrome c551/c552